MKTILALGLVLVTGAAAMGQAPANTITCTIGAGAGGNQAAATGTFGGFQNNIIKKSEIKWYTVTYNGNNKTLTYLKTDTANYNPFTNGATQNGNLLVVPALPSGTIICAEFKLTSDPNQPVPRGAQLGVTSAEYTIP